MTIDATDSAAARLRELETVTDARLGRLEVDDLLVELLSRVRTILDADTAAVLMLDEATQHLVPRAACGLEEEVQQRVRVPLGQASPVGSRNSNVRSGLIASMLRRSSTRSSGRRVCASCSEYRSWLESV